MSNYTAGRRAEYRTMRLMEAAGYRCIRAASSKGVWDVVAVGSTDIVLIQVKKGARPSPSEYAEMRDVKLPANVRQIVHWWPPRSSVPEVIEV